MTTNLLLASSPNSLLRVCGVALALTLPGCVLQTKLGDVPDGETSTPAESATDTDGATSEEPATTGTLQPDTSETTGEPETTGDPATSSGTTGDPATSEGTTGTPLDACEPLDEAGCLAAPECMARYGQQVLLGNCPEEPNTYLGCMVNTGCGEVETTVCSVGDPSLAYRMPDNCVPAGFEECEPGDVPLCTPSECPSLSEEACAADPTCKAIYGAPHIEQDKQICADFENQQFLGCDYDLGACPPFVPTVCPEGQPGPKFDVAAGCVPPGFEVCTGGVLSCE